MLLILDIGSKVLALRYLKPIGSMPIIEGIFSLTFVENRGAAFGILQGQRWFFVLLTLAVAIVIIIAFGRLPHNRENHWLRAALVLLLSGAVGNAIDRALRGYVVDFLEATFFSFPVFNLADIYVVAGTILTAVLLLFVIREEPKKGEEV